MTVLVETPYWDWIRDQAAAIGADGCTRVTQYRQVCCFEHDVAYYWGRDPRAAYRMIRDGHLTVLWENIAPITRAEADARFWRCHEQRSILKRFSFVAAWRWAGVRIGGWVAWERHRKVRP